MLTAVRKYYSRVLLLLILLVFVGCCEDEGCGGIDKDFGVETLSGSRTLTTANPSFKVETKEAAIVKGATAEIHFRWEQEKKYEEKPEANTKNNKPPVKITFTTKAKGAPGLKAEGPKFDGVDWVYNCSYPAMSDKARASLETPPLAPFTLSVIAQQPIIKIPNMPRINLPFIGPIIGPTTKAIYVTYDIRYYIYSGEK